DPRPLVEFLWRFSHSTPSERGHDPNVCAATDEEANIAREKLKEWAPKKETPIVVFTVPGKDGEKRKFLAWKSMKSPYSTIGRCTRAYPVYEIATSRYCFLKDGWRAHELDPEATILQELAEKKVENVPIFVCGGDVETEATMTDLYVPAPDSTQSDTNPYPPRRESKWKKAGTNKRITRRIHHRFIVNTIGKPLNTFRDSKQLLQVVYDAFKGETDIHTLRVHLFLTCIYSQLTDKPAKRQGFFIVTLALGTYSSTNTDMAFSSTGILQSTSKTFNLGGTTRLRFVVFFSGVLLYAHQLL
ncbi:hypothetical protein H0H87_010960, partial [Tephrocybe sp. NHM501043]